MPCSEQSENSNIPPGGTFHYKDNNGNLKADIEVGTSKPSNNYNDELRVIVTGDLLSRHVL